jgi:hypothetical protein
MNREYDIKNTKDKKIKKDKDQVDEELENIEDEKYEENQLWEIISFSDIHYELCELLSKYSEIDNRLIWITMDNILYGRHSSKNLPDDEDIKCFIREILDLINNTKNSIRREEDEDDFDTLFYLSEETIYGRIVHRLEKWHLY